MDCGEAAVWNPVNDHVYVTNYSSGVAVIDGRTNQVIKQVAAASANALCLNPVMDKLYVTTDNNMMYVLDAAADTILHSVIVPDGPWDMVFSNTTNKLYVNCNDGDLTRVRVYDGASDTLIAEIRFSDFGGDRMLWSPDGNRVLCPAAPDTMCAIDCTTDQVASRIPTPGGFRDICWDAVNHRVYALYDTKVYVFNAIADSIVAVIPLPTFNSANICAAPFPNKLFAANGSWTYVIDGGTNRISDSIRVNLGFMTCDTHKAKVYAAARPPQVLDARGDSVLASIPVSAGDIETIVWDQTDSRVYMLDFENSAIYVIRDTATGIAEPAGGISCQERADATVFSGTLLFSSSAPASLLDLTGRRVGRLKPGANDVHQLRTGVYFIKPDNEAAARKIVIQN
jgi:YVTN family beta-propeller protein